MRWNVFFVLVVVLLLVLCGCGKSVEQQAGKGVDAMKQSDQSKDVSSDSQDSKDKTKEEGKKSEKVVVSSKTTKNEDKKSGEQSGAEAVTEYAPQANIVKHFAGEGNEFAKYSSETYGKQQALLGIVDHSGADVLKVYRITPEQITWVYSQEGFPGGDIPDLKVLEAKSNKNEVLLQAPLEKNATFGDWTIVETGSVVTLPYGKLKDVVIVQKKSANGDVTTRYWAKNLGIVKSVNTFKGEDGKSYTVTSELESVDQK